MLGENQNHAEIQRTEKQRPMRIRRGARFSVMRVLRGDCIAECSCRSPRPDDLTFRAGGSATFK